MNTGEYDELKDLIEQVKSTVEEMHKDASSRRGDTVSSRMKRIELRTEYLAGALAEALIKMDDINKKLVIAVENYKVANKDKPPFGTWEWFRDGLGMQVVTVVLTVVVLKLVDVLVLHWNIVPK